MLFPLGKESCTPVQIVSLFTDVGVPYNGLISHPAWGNSNTVLLLLLRAVATEAQNTMLPVCFTMTNLRLIHKHSMQNNL